MLGLDLFFGSLFAALGEIFAIILALFGLGGM